MRPRPFFLILLLTLACGLLVSRGYHRFQDPTLTLTFFDVGQGDAALVRFPRGHTMLVDAGGGLDDWDVGSRELFPELARMGILSLDIAFLTHPDRDHGYGFRGLFRELQVEELWTSAAFLRDRPGKPLMRELEALAEVEPAKVVAFSEEKTGTIAGVGMRVIPLWTPGTKTNNRSLVLLLEYGGCRALFTGDIEAVAEAELVAKGIPTVSILKVAHHGSKTSSTEAFLATTRPEWAVISVGMRNSYGHPNTGVLHRLRRGGAQTFRTDLHGFVEFSISALGEVRCRTSHGSCGVDRCESRHFD